MVLSVVMSVLPISTKTGDEGETSLANGKRLPKTDLLFEVLGTLDELNSWLGVIVSQLATTDSTRDFLLKTQDILFQIGAEVAASPKVKVTDTAVKELERHSNELQASFAQDWTVQFIYPGGTLLAAQIDVTRTVCRRLERVLLRYHNQSPIGTPIRKYINRLSDYLFVLRCDKNRAAGFSEKKFSYAKKLVG